MSLRRSPQAPENEVIGWVLSFGSGVRVLRPHSLSDAVASAKKDPAFISIPVGRNRLNITRSRSQLVSLKRGQKIR